MDRARPEIFNTSELKIVEDCPVCFRTIWAGTKCSHGRPPSPYSPSAPVEKPLAVDDPDRLDPPKKRLRGGL